MTRELKKLILAPMEGVIDSLMRELLTSINDYDLCITEFIRVVDELVPRHIYKKICPELNNNGKTKYNVPVRIQLLGQNPDWLAENAVRAIELGSHGVDLNFGCPAKAVNKSKGGAILLQQPERIYAIIKSVKDALGPMHITSAKIRLGYENTDNFKEIVDAVHQAGADSLVVHARTKKDGYRPPAYWYLIEQARKQIPIEIIANGEIWSRSNAIQCLNESNTSSLMLGRGALALPNLANVIKHNEKPYSFKQMKQLLNYYSIIERSESDSFYFSSRLKQWLKYLKLEFSEASLLFDEIKKLKDKHQIMNIIESIS
jgi:tRNA-dihydrouridine synthase C